MIRHYHFDGIRLDARTRELRRGEHVLVLPPRMFDCLLWLIEHRDRAVGRDELVAAVWNRTDVEDNLLAQLVARLRRLIDDDRDAGGSAIRTIPRFGYRWVRDTRVIGEAEAIHPVATADEAPSVSRDGFPAPVRSGDRDDGQVVATDRSDPPAGERPPLPSRTRLATAMGTLARVADRVVSRSATIRAATAVGVLLCVAIVLSGIVKVGLVDAPWTRTVSMSLPGDRDVTLVLPATLDVDERGGDWIPFSLMAVVADRLGDLGQRVVPSDNVVALMRGMDGQAQAADTGTVTALSRASGAGVVITSSARRDRDRWTVSLRTAGTVPPLEANAVAADVLDAGRVAADRMAVHLGHRAARAGDRPSIDANPSPLLRRVVSATLAGRTELAQSLLDSADPGERVSWEWRYQHAWIAFVAGRFDIARAEFEALLVALPDDGEPVMRARTHNGLANVAYLRGDVAALARHADAAAMIAGRHGATREHARALMGRAVAATRQDRPDAAREDFRQSRIAFDRVDDRLGALRAELALAIVDKQARRLDEAIAALTRVVDSIWAFGDVHDELVARTHLAEAQLLMNDPAAALIQVPHLAELSTRVQGKQATTLAGLTRSDILRANGREDEARAVLDSTCGDGGLCRSGSLAPQYEQLRQALGVHGDSRHESPGDVLASAH